MTGADEVHPLLGRLIAGRWELLRFLGDGAVGSVFEARHVLIGRKAAIKILHRELVDQPHLRASFLREARAVNWVNHHNIAEVVDFGESEDALAYLVMELLEGERLAERIARGPLTLSLALEVVEQIASALAHAHDLGVVHRDLKPEHVFLVRRGGRPNFVKLVDFGLASLARDGQSQACGTLLGTPGYMAPELLRGGEVGPAADLYALGVMFFEMVTGRPPFEAEDLATLLEQHRTCPPPDPVSLCAGLDPMVSHVILRLLEKDPTRRYTEAYRLLEDCRSIETRLGLSADPQLGPASAPSAAVGQAPEALATWALKSALLGRMAAAAYPGGGGPAHLDGSVDRMWRFLARLCQLDGELEVTEGFNQNERARAHEVADDVARQIAELSRLSSRMHRRVEAAETELDRLAAIRDAAGRRLAELREQIQTAEEDDAGRNVAPLLHEAGATAAQHQMQVEAISKVADKVVRWLQEAERAAALSERLREQLRTQSERLEAEGARRESRVNALYAERSGLLATLHATEAELREHFLRRRECQGLLAELGRLEVALGGQGRDSGGTPPEAS